MPRVMMGWTLLVCSVVFMTGCGAGADQKARAQQPDAGKGVNERKEKMSKAEDSKALRVEEISGDCSRLTLSFSHDLDLDQAKRAENYQITPEDVEELRVMVVGKFVTLEGLRLKKGKKYKIKIAQKVKGAKGKSLSKEGRTVGFTPIYERRMIKVSVVQPLKYEERYSSWVKHHSSGDKGLEGYLEYVERYVDEAGRRGSDIVCLPEGVKTQWGHQTVPGPYYERMAAKARKYSMYVVAHVMEKDGKALYGTAFVIDRSGNLVGKYRKVHTYVTRGNTFPVFQTDFGKIGIIICSDMFAYCECARILALNGAEIIFVPHSIGGAGVDEVIVTSRGMALQNCLYIVPCHFGRIMDEFGYFGRSCIIAPNGLILADAGKAPGVVSGIIDLEYKRLVTGCGMGPGICNMKRGIFKYRRPSVYGDLVKKK